LEKGKSVSDISNRLGTSFRTVTKVRKMIGIQKMDKQQGDEFVKVLQEQPIVSAFEYVETMAD
jgi:DNA-binding NarL/FixJ family response regulator